MGQEPEQTRPGPLWGSLHTRARGSTGPLLTGSEPRCGPGRVHTSVQRHNRVPSGTHRVALERAQVWVSLARCVHEAADTGLVSLCAGVHTCVPHSQPERGLEGFRVRQMWVSVLPTLTGILSGGLS